MRKIIPLLAPLMLTPLLASCTAYYGPPPPPPPPRVVYAPPPPVVVRPAPVVVRPAPAPVVTNGAVSAFYSSLSPYGQWVITARFGQCWRPYGVPAGGRPYTNGYWILTDYGWTFVSNAPWSWACYHYGRWFSDSRYGWVWYPGLEWAPAWVVWRTGGDYVGWAPIPPGVTVSQFGFSPPIYSIDTVFPSFAFSFVRIEDFGRRDVDSFIISGSRSAAIVGQTNIFVGIGRENGRIVNRFNDEPGFEARIERYGHHPIERYRLGERRGPGPAEVRGNEVRMYRPDFRRSRGRDGHSR